MLLDIIGEETTSIYEENLVDKTHKMGGVL
jgi:hypothetical protein